MEFSESIKQSLSGKPTTAIETPPIQVGLQTSVNDVSSNGDAHVSYSYGDVTVFDDGSVDASQREQLQSALAPVASVTGTATLTARNQTVDTKIAGTEGFDPTVAQLMSQLAEQFGSIAVPFPREAVGIGGGARQLFASSEWYRRPTDVHVHLART